MDPIKVDGILKWPVPTKVKEVQSFLGFANFYRRFIRNFAGISKTLTSLTKKDVPFQWSDTCQQAFQDLKDRFTSLPVLAHYHVDRLTIVETDASDYAIAAVLSQVDPFTKHSSPYCLLLLFYVST